jgi:hypothetical protein
MTLLALGIGLCARSLYSPDLKITVEKQRLLSYKAKMGVDCNESHQWPETPEVLLCMVMLHTVLKLHLDY